MNTMKLAFAGLAMTAALTVGAAGGPAAAQDDRMWRPEPAPEAIIYRDAGYNGPAVAVSRAQADMRLAWTVTSIRVRSGRWELCERPDFKGSCRTVVADNPVIMRGGLRMQSMRPLGWTDPGAPGDNPSLRGTESEFYPAPARNGRRVLACQAGNANSNCAARTADMFCRTMGWKGAVHQTLEKVGNRNYLADTLCVRSGY